MNVGSAFAQTAGAGEQNRDAASINSVHRTT
jgi:hypothetical protein